MQELTPAMLDEWLRKLLQTGLSRNTLSAVHTLLNNALNYAVYPVQLINSNPAAYIKVPKNAPRNVVKRHIITPERFAALLKKYPFGSPPYIPLLLLYHTGMRVGEVLGLTWDDVDFAGKSLKITRQVVYVNGKKDCLTTPKTATRERTVLVDDFLLSELARWQDQQKGNEIRFGERYVYAYCNEQRQIVRQSKAILLDAEKIAFVCTREKGQPVQKKFISKYLRLEGLNAHSFRHTHITQLIENGAPAKGVAERLGHADVSITQNLHTHHTKKMQTDTLAVFVENLQTSI